VPDILSLGLDVVFCGINPATSAECLGHNFSHPSNRFWEVLYRSGFTPERLEPQQECELLSYACGITAVVTRPTKRASEVSLDEFRFARAPFERKIRSYAPRIVAFLGKRAVSAMLNERIIAFGRQSAPIAGSVAWVLPNPSGLNWRFDVEALTLAYAELRTAVNGLGG
jgi:double-stranded uracil-DNA glycosylase